MSPNGELKVAHNGSRSRGFDLTYISFGAGVQSTAMLICSNLGLHGVPKADVAFFADTTEEPAWVYDNVERLKAWSKIPVELVKAPEKILNLKELVLSAPLWCMGSDHRPAPMKRQCTNHYKIEPITRGVRSKVGSGRKKAKALIGISLDEFHRMKDSRIPWISNGFPLVDAMLNRQDCKRIVEEQGLQIPYRSACVFCPFHSDDYWKTLKERFPEEWQRACEIDDSLVGLRCGKNSRPMYLHRTLQRLRYVNLSSDQMEFGWSNECGGICGL